MIITLPYCYGQNDRTLFIGGSMSQTLANKEEFFVTSNKLKKNDTTFYTSDIYPGMEFDFIHNKICRMVIGNKTYSANNLVFHSTDCGDFYTFYGNLLGQNKFLFCLQKSEGIIAVVNLNNGSFAIKEDIEKHEMAVIISLLFSRK
ncbi:hypothetical protein [Persicobacter psychrovividus]|uniref:Uncharacterized protein n=1 Tax=Persicobacter psychrovividus TaxID=387638 RepID=A0ABM7VMQ9_9BACT|nr:hypothetical protein PEPS_45810 [Persicobacter psychrovividus]